MLISDYIDKPTSSTTSYYSKSLAIIVHSVQVQELKKKRKVCWQTRPPFSDPNGFIPFAFPSEINMKQFLATMNNVKCKLPLLYAPSYHGNKQKKWRHPPFLLWNCEFVCVNWNRSRNCHSTVFVFCFLFIRSAVYSVVSVVQHSASPADGGTGGAMNQPLPT